MDFLDQKLILLGVLIALLLFICNLLFSFLAISFKIKILEFGMFFSPKFSLFATQMMHTKFSLGWLPFGGFVKLLGMTTDSDEQAAIPEEELSSAFFRKKAYQKALILFVPTITYLFCGIVFSFILLKNQNNTLELNDLIGYVKEAFISMFGDESQIKQFGLLSKRFAAENNVVVFAFFVLSCLMFIFFSIDNLSNVLDQNPKKSRIQSIIKSIVTLLCATLLLWKVPALIFEYYSFPEVLIFILNCLLGIVLGGTTLFFTLVIVLKTFTKSKQGS